MNEKNITRLAGLTRLLFGLMGLLMMTPVITATYAYMVDSHLLGTTLFLFILGTALLMGSQKRRYAALHFIYKTVGIENLMMTEGEESRMLEQREEQAGETRSLDCWR